MSEDGHPQWDVEPIFPEFEDYLQWRHNERSLLRLKQLGDHVAFALARGNSWEEANRQAAEESAYQSKLDTEYGLFRGISELRQDWRVRQSMHSASL